MLWVYLFLGLCILVSGLVFYSAFVLNSRQSDDDPDERATVDYAEHPTAPQAQQANEAQSQDQRPPIQEKDA